MATVLKTRIGTDFLRKKSLNLFQLLSNRQDISGVKVTSTSWERFPNSFYDLKKFTVNSDLKSGEAVGDLIWMGKLKKENVIVEDAMKDDWKLYYENDIELAKKVKGSKLLH